MAGQFTGCTVVAGQFTGCTVVAGQFRLYCYGRTVQVVLLWPDISQAVLLRPAVLLWPDSSGCTAVAGQFTGCAAVAGQFTGCTDRTVTVQVVLYLQLWLKRATQGGRFCRTCVYRPLMHTMGTLYTYPPTHPAIQQNIHLSTETSSYPPTHPPIYQDIQLSANLSTYSLIHPPRHPYIYGNTSTYPPRHPHRHPPIHQRISFSSSQQTRKCPRLAPSVRGPQMV